MGSNQSKLKTDDSNKITRMLALGVPGSGKSSIGNVLLSGKHDSQIFLSVLAPAEGGVTKLFVSKKAKFFGNSENQYCKYYDSPGIGDYTMNYKKAVESLERELKGKKIDVAFMTIQANSNRFTTEQLLSAKFFSYFLLDLKPISTFLIITHCDQNQDFKQEKWIDQKLEKFQQYGLTIPRENVVFYDRSIKSLYQFASKAQLINGNIMLVSDAQEKASCFLNDVQEQIPVDSKIYNEVKELKELMIEYQKKIEELNKNQEKTDKSLGYRNMQGKIIPNSEVKYLDWLRVSQEKPSIKVYTQYHMKELFNINGQNLSDCKLLGKGGFGVVFLVTNKQNNQKYAVKKFRTQNEEEYDQIIDEAFRISQLTKHQNICQNEFIYTQCSLQDQYFDVMVGMPPAEQDLQSKIKSMEEQNQQVSMEEFLQFANDCTQSLFYLKLNDIYHSDIKPQNILIFNKNYAIADFGLTSLNIKGKIQNEKDIQGYTRDYASPELKFFFENEPDINEYTIKQGFAQPKTMTGIQNTLNQRANIDIEKCDIWSLGLTFLAFYLLIQKPTLQNINQISDQNVKFLIQGMLQYDASLRFRYVDVLSQLEQMNNILIEQQQQQYQQNDNLLDKQQQDLNEQFKETKLVEKRKQVFQ